MSVPRRKHFCGLPQFEGEKLTRKNNNVGVLEIERQLVQEGFKWIIGVDEAGRGPLAGPVVAAAVILKEIDFDSPIRDSKKLTPKQRTKAFCEIQQKAFFGFGVMSEAVIDQVNILNATYHAMNDAVQQCVIQVILEQADEKDICRQACMIIDGNRFKSQTPIAYRTAVKGDQKSMSIAAASILAKVMRDRIIEKYDQVFPQYGFKQHKGYPTAKHKQALREHGLSMIHRTTFRF